MSASVRAAVLPGGRSGSPPAHRAQNLDSRQRLCLTSSALLVALGTTTLVLIYTTGSHETPPYTLFFLGLLLLFLPLWYLAIFFRAREAHPVQDLLVLIGLSVATYLPTFLRAPDRPLFGDSFGHFLPVQNLLRDGNAFASDPPVPIASDFPGLHTLAAPLVQIFGVPTWRIAVLLLVLFRIAAILAVYSIVRSLGGDPRSAMLGAVIYSLNPQLAFFDGQFAYESFALPLFLWTIALVVRKSGERRNSNLVLVAACATGLCCVVTHHLSTYILVAVVLVMAACEAVRREALSARRTALVGVVVGVCAVGWVVATGVQIVPYIGPFIKSALHSGGPIINKLLGHTPAPVKSGTTVTPTRSLFTSSSLPTYGRAAAFAVPVLVLGSLVFALQRLRRNISGAQLGLLLLAASYIATTPLRLTPSGEATAGRASTFQWAGVAIVVALAAFSGPGPSMGPSFARLRRISAGLGSLLARRRVPAAFTAVLLTVVLVGNQAIGANAEEIFPGPFVLDSTNGRDAPSEAVTVAKAYLKAEGPDTSIAADASTERIFNAYAFTLANRRFPQWVFFDSRKSSASLEAAARQGDIRAIVIDRRVLGQGLGNVVLWGSPPRDLPPIPATWLRHLEGLSWLKVSVQTRHYVVLEVSPTVVPPQGDRS